MDVNLIQAIEEDFSIMDGDTFNPFLDFFQDDKATIPIDLTGSSFVMDIQRQETGCFCFGTTLKEVLAIGTGLTIKDDDAGNVNNRLQISKILESDPGKFKQDITWTDAGGTVRTIERGSLKIVAKA